MAEGTSAVPTTSWYNASTMPSNTTAGAVPYAVWNILLIVIEVFSMLLYALVIYGMLRYRKLFYNAHYFYKAAVQLAFFDNLGLIFSIMGQTCICSKVFCIPMAVGLMTYFNTQVMLVIIAFNRFSAVVLYKYYATIYNSKWVTWLCLIPPMFTVCRYSALYKCVNPDPTCEYWPLFIIIDRVATIAIITSIVIMYFAAYFYQRCCNNLHQMSENRFLYQATITAGFLVVLYAIAMLGNLNDQRILLIYNYLWTLHFACAPYVYVFFNKKLRRHLLHLISCGRFQLQSAVHPISTIHTKIAVNVKA